MWPVAPIVDSAGWRSRWGERRQALPYPSINSPPPTASNTVCAHPFICTPRQLALGCADFTFHPPPRCTWGPQIHIHSQCPQYLLPPLCFLSPRMVLSSGHLPIPDTQLASLTSPCRLHIQTVSQCWEIFLPRTLSDPFTSFPLASTLVQAIISSGE